MGNRKGSQSEHGDPNASSPVLRTAPLGFMWETRDPFLFCVHHDDHYPAGNERFGPATSLAGRPLGQDFDLKDGFRMYHGEVVPGFPRHPHRGFETVTIVRRGLLDHADSMGAGARYGGGDVQWLTAGSGIQHAEMFPLLQRDAPNPVELFQIWLNLPSDRKMVSPHFSMFWRERIPSVSLADSQGRTTEVTVIAGRLGQTAGLQPPPNSWAADAQHDVAIWTIRMAAGARFELPQARPGTVRSLYVFAGEGLSIEGHRVAANRQVEVDSTRPAALDNGPASSEVLMLQGQPIGEPIARHGPFVMNSPAEIQAAYADYQRTQFGGWPWASADPVHGGEAERFARHADGKLERPG